MHAKLSACLFYHSVPFPFDFALNTSRRCVQRPRHTSCCFCCMFAQDTRLVLSFGVRVSLSDYCCQFEKHFWPPKRLLIEAQLMPKFQTVSIIRKFLFFDIFVFFFNFLLGDIWQLSVCSSRLCNFEIVFYFIFFFQGVVLRTAGKTRRAECKKRPWHIKKFSLKKRCFGMRNNSVYSKFKW